MQEKYTISVRQAYDRLQDAGVAIGYVKLREGIIQGVFPFGRAIKAPSGQLMFVIYAADLERFIEEKKGSLGNERN